MVALISLVAVSQARRSILPTTPIHAAAQRAIGVNELVVRISFPVCRLTPAGKKQLGVEVSEFEKVMRAIARVIQPA